MSKFPACFEDDRWARDCLFEEILFITTVLVSHLVPNATINSTLCYKNNYYSLTTNYNNYYYSCSK